MEEENKRTRRKEKSAYIDGIRTLADHVKGLDPRVEAQQARTRARTRMRERE